VLTVAERPRRMLAHARRAVATGCVRSLWLGPERATSCSGDQGMDPITNVLSALSSAGKPVADHVITDGYAGLKALIVRRFGSSHPL
jgi:hypothetical protein